jgi:hypothetical protein
MVLFYPGRDLTARHHFSFTWVNATGVLRAYVDGVLWIESFLANTVGYVINGSCEFYLGQYYVCVVFWIFVPTFIDRFFLPI